MCILINSDKCNIAEKDIVTYKVLFPTSNAGIFRSIIKYFKYIIGKTYTEPDMEKTLFKVTNDRYETVRGFYSWKDLAYASHKLNIYNLSGGGHRYVLVKCIIPKGSVYYESVDLNIATLCSDTIKIVAYYKRNIKKWVDENKNCDEENIPGKLL